jgi:hypothetical protein
MEGKIILGIRKLHELTLKSKNKVRILKVLNQKNSNYSST